MQFRAVSIRADLVEALEREAERRGVDADALLDGLINRALDEAEAQVEARPPTEDVVSIELALRAFDDGFAQGANPKKRAARHTVDSTTHKHWRAGFDAGRAAYEEAARKYRSELEV